MDDQTEYPSEEEAREALARRGVPPNIVEGLTLAQVYAALGLPSPEEDERADPKP